MSFLTTKFGLIDFLNFAVSCLIDAEVNIITPWNNSKLNEGKKFT